MQQKNDSNATEELLRVAVEGKDSAVKLVTSVQSAVRLAESAVREQMATRPYVTMGAAAGAGYVLAGGLASSITRGLVKAGTKAATAALIGFVLKKAKDVAEDAKEAVDAANANANANTPAPAPAE